MSGVRLKPCGRATKVYRLLDRSLDWEDFADWLTKFHKHHRRKPIVVWGSHCARMKAVSGFREAETSWSEFRKLPSYSLDSIPPERLWSDVKYHAVSDGVPKVVDKPYSGTQRACRSRKTQLKFFFAGDDPTSA